MKMYSLAVTPNGHLEGRGSMPPPIIMRTAATPMPTPKCSPHMDSVHTFVDSRRGSNASIDPMSYDQKSLVGVHGKQLSLKCLQAAQVTCVYIYIYIHSDFWCLLVLLVLLRLIATRHSSRSRDLAGTACFGNWLHFACNRGAGGQFCENRGSRLNRQSGFLLLLICPIPLLCNCNIMFKSRQWTVKVLHTETEPLSPLVSCLVKVMLLKRK